MDPALEKALETDRVIDITTTGRKTGEPRRIEIWGCNDRRSLRRVAGYGDPDRIRTDDLHLDRVAC